MARERKKVEPKEKKVEKVESSTSDFSFKEDDLVEVVITNMGALYETITIGDEEYMIQPSNSLEIKVLYKDIDSLKAKVEYISDKLKFEMRG